MYETFDSKETILNHLRTGDIILTNPQRSFPLSCLSKAIKFFTGSKFSHVGMILKDPYFVADKAKLNFRKEVVKNVITNSVNGFW